MCGPEKLWVLSLTDRVAFGPASEASLRPGLSWPSMAFLILFFKWGGEVVVFDIIFNLHVWTIWGWGNLSFQMKSNPVNRRFLNWERSLLQKKE